MSNNPYGFLMYAGADKINVATRIISAKLAESRPEYEEIRNAHGVYVARRFVYERVCGLLDAMDEDLGAGDSEPSRAIMDEIVTWDAMDIAWADGDNKPVRDMYFALVRALYESKKLAVVGEDETYIKVDGAEVVVYLRGKKMADVCHHIDVAIDVFCCAYIDLVKGYNNS